MLLLLSCCRQDWVPWGLTALSFFSRQTQWDPPTWDSPGDDASLEHEAEMDLGTPTYDENPMKVSVGSKGGSSCFHLLTSCEESREGRGEAWQKCFYQAVNPGATPPLSSFAAAFTLSADFAFDTGGDVSLSLPQTSRLPPGSIPGVNEILGALELGFLERRLLNDIICKYLSACEKKKKVN